MTIDENKHKIKKLLAEFLGIELSDLSDEDMLRDDLHMGPVDLTDFAQILSDNGLDIKVEDWNEIETVSEIHEYVNA
jgi:acyl carrier protein